MQNNSSTHSAANITRYFWLFIVLLLMTVGLYAYNYTNAYLTEKKHALTNIANGLQQRIDDYRYHTYQIYDLVNNPIKASEPLLWCRKPACALTFTILKASQKD